MRQVDDDHLSAGLVLGARSNFEAIDKVSAQSPFEGILPAFPQS